MSAYCCCETSGTHCNSPTIRRPNHSRNRRRSPFALLRQRIRKTVPKVCHLTARLGHQHIGWRWTSVPGRAKVTSGPVWRKSPTSGNITIAVELSVSICAAADAGHYASGVGRQSKAWALLVSFPRCGRSFCTSEPNSQAVLRDRWPRISPIFLGRAEVCFGLQCNLASVPSRRSLWGNLVYRVAKRHSARWPRRLLGSAG